MQPREREARTRARGENKTKRMPVANEPHKFWRTRMISSIRYSCRCRLATRSEPSAESSSSSRRRVLLVVVLVVASPERERESSRGAWYASNVYSSRMARRTWLTVRSGNRLPSPRSAGRARERRAPCDRLLYVDGRDPLYISLGRASLPLSSYLFLCLPLCAAAAGLLYACAIYTCI